MELLKEIIRRPGMKTEGKTLQREAVRGVIAREQQLLLLYSTRLGDFKFPGGGVQRGETHAQALTREIREECGGVVTNIGQPFGKIIEYDLPKEREYDVFMMTSFYYWCQVEPMLSEQHLDAYEKELGFQPIWLEIDEAIRINNHLLRTQYRAEYRWLARETFVLEKIKARQLQGQHG